MNNKTIVNFVYADDIVIANGLSLGRKFTAIVNNIVNTITDFCFDWESCFNYQTFDLDFWTH